MRRIVYSHTFRDQLTLLLEQGIPWFGPNIVANKRDLVFDTIERVIAAQPAIKQPNPDLSLVVYPIADTPFVVLYDFDDNELRMHFVFHRRADTRSVDPNDIDW